eukprot:TRINITY_DN10776_c0_g1_i4.p1 TRINITY_DN10776_c0_g1~~TRINITY_DN10776_c0_g1_i4.p1  ORF type:complete len:552 (-),score=119.11 TRINITY_DN10776_c0_g1_i4:367-2022(-)
MIRRPPRSTLSSSSAASDVYKRQAVHSLHPQHPSNELTCSLRLVQMPFRHTRVRFRHTRTLPTLDADFVQPPPSQKNVSFMEPVALTRSCLPLKFEEIVGTENCDYWMGFAEERMDYVRKLQVSIEAFCEIEEKAVALQRAWRKRRPPPSPSAHPVLLQVGPEREHALSPFRRSIHRSISTDQLIHRTKMSVTLKPSLRKSQQETHAEKLRIATLEAHRRAQRRMVKKREKRLRRRARSIQGEAPSEDQGQLDVICENEAADVAAEGHDSEQYGDFIVVPDEDDAGTIQASRTEETSAENHGGATAKIPDLLAHPSAPVNPNPSPHPVKQTPSWDNLDEEVGTQFLRRSLENVSSPRSSGQPATQQAERGIEYSSDGSSSSDDSDEEFIRSIGDRLAARLIRSLQPNQAFRHTTSYTDKQRAYLQYQAGDSSSSDEDTTTSSDTAHSSFFRIFRSDSLFSTDSAPSVEGSQGSCDQCEVLELPRNSTFEMTLPVSRRRRSDVSSSDDMSPVMSNPNPNPQPQCRTNVSRSSSHGSIFDRITSFALFSSTPN